MKSKIFVLTLVFLFLFPAVYGEELSITEDEELKEIVLKQFLPSPHIQAEQPAGASVKALMIGITKYDPPDSPEWDIYHFYDYYWDGNPDRWIGFIVVNYSDRDVQVKIRLELCYDQGKTLWNKIWTRTIQENRAMLYYIKTNRPKKIGLYSLKGKLYGAEGVGPNNEVSTYYYIYEIW